jgi:hypothetical protein
MKTAFLALLIAFSFNSFAATLVSTSPEVDNVSIPGNFEGSFTNFISMGDGTYGIIVSLQSTHYYSGTKNYNAYFKPNEGVIRKVGNTLVFSLDGVETVIATKGRWFNSWKLKPGVSIATNIEESDRRLGWDVYSVSAELVID